MKKKLIEVALPLDAINAASRKEKSIFFGHPSSLHLWWARRPLAACRAVLFAQLVDDPSAHADRFPTEADQDKERERLFDIMRDLVEWDNSADEVVLGKARKEIVKSCDGRPPPVLDPFAGGGSIPLEAQRLGLKAEASDLNPVAVLINKALIEIPPRFAGQPPAHPEAEMRMRWQGAQGLAEDVRHYGRWMRQHARERIGRLYPDVELPSQYGGGRAAGDCVVVDPYRGLRQPCLRSRDALGRFVATIHQEGPRCLDSACRAGCSGVPGSRLRCAPQRRRAAESAQIRAGQVPLC